MRKTKTNTLRNKPAVKSCNGWYRLACGNEKRLDGELKTCRFYISKDKDEYERKARAIEARWLELKAQGATFWSDGELERLEQMGFIRQRTRLKSTDAAKLLANISEDPLTKSELAPFLDEKGVVRVDAAPQAIDTISRKVFSRDDVRKQFDRTLYIEAMRDPLGTFERCSKCFGWSSKETTNFIFNGFHVPGSPIAYDATEDPKPLGVLDLVVGIDKSEGDNETITPSDH